jgi:hypothetical protein
MIIPSAGTWRFFLRLGEMTLALGGVVCYNSVI